MKKVRNSSIAVLLTALALILGVFTPSVAQATSTWDSLIHTSPTLFVYTDGSTKSQKMDVSQSWYESLRQAYAARVQQNPDSFPSNFMTELDAARSSGSWGVFMVENANGNYLEVIGTRDPNATCGFTGDASTGSFQCSTHPGYGFVDLYTFTYNTYGGGNCGAWVNVCSNDGMVVTSPPVVQTGTAGYVMWTPNTALLSHYLFYTMHFNITYPDGYTTSAKIPTSPPPATYVAMGDSYSSGEGNAPYEAGTDQDGDRCHRSPAAYPRKVQNALNLGTTAFVACSGAKIHDILNINSTNIEYAQALFISSQTSVITMSIGGNDVNFAPAMQTCTVKNAATADQTSAGLTQDQVDQADCAQALSTSGSLVNTTLSANLTNLYKSVESITPSAKLLIVGYPQIFPEYSSISGSCTWGSALPPPANGVGTPSGRAVSSTEVGTIRSLTTQMDGLIKTAVDNTNNSNIMFIDPTTTFAGHELCTGSPWLNGVMLNVDPVYIAGSYHPNAAGQAAYASAVATKISSLTLP